MRYKNNGISEGVSGGRIDSAYAWKTLWKISIQEIADKSGVGRATWLWKYNGKNEALTFKLIVLWNRWSDEHNVSVRDRFPLQNAKECYQARFYSYGLFGLLDEWVKRGYKETPDEMVNILYQVMDDRNDN